MESIDSLQEELKRVSQALSSHQSELHQTRGYLHCILQSSNDMIFATDIDGILVSFSRGGERVLGYTWEEVAAKLVRDFAGDPDDFERLMAASRERGSAHQGEVPFVHKKGHTVYCDVFLIELTNRGGQNVGTVGVCRDITMWKNLQEDLVKIDKLAEIGKMVSGVAHDINNPLANISEISGWVGTVVSDADELTGEDKEELQIAVRRIAEQTRRCRDITRQILDFVRHVSPARTSVDVHKVLKETVRFLQHEFKASPVEIIFDFCERSLCINSDPKMLQQIFVNLISNAIYAVKEKGADKGFVEVKTSKAGPDIEITIADDGIGISPEEQARIFDLFYTTKPSSKGTGLGLPICRNIVKKVGGDIVFESEAGKGSTFTVRLPLT